MPTAVDGWQKVREQNNCQFLSRTSIPATPETKTLPSFACLQQIYTPEKRHAEEQCGATHKGRPCPKLGK